jgi:translation elongation factor EF-1beta
MSFRGELREFELPDILQLIASQQKAGWLKVISKGQCHFVFFRDGKITSTKNPAEEIDPLETYMAKRGLLPHEALDRLAALRRKTGMDVQDLIQKEGLLSREEIHRIFEAMVEEDIFDLITMRNATYEFETEDRSAPLPKGALVADIGPILMEGARKAVEIAEMRKGLGPGVERIVLTALGRDREKGIDQEEQVLALVNGVRTIDMILEESQLDRYTATRILFECAKKGIVARLKTAAAPGREERESTGELDVRRALRWVAPVLILLLSAVFLSDAHRGGRGGDLVLGEWLQQLDQARQARIREDIRISLEAHRIKSGSYPPSLDVLSKEGLLSEEELLRHGVPRWDYRLNPHTNSFALLPAPAASSKAVH